MNILLLGGTHFVGLHIAHALLAGGHAVAVLNRGVSPDTLPAQVLRLRGDRDAGPPGLAAAGASSWDACIDVSGYTPRQVRASAETLRDAVKRYVFVSAVMVYGDTQQRPVTESNPRVPPAAEDTVDVDGSTYGPLKVACEDIVQAVFGDAATLLRPQVIVGPGDDWNRYTHWVQRAMRGGDMLAPGDGSDHLQVIDVRDVAAFVRTVVENGLGGAFNLAGPRMTWAQFMAILGLPGARWVPAEVLQRAGLTFRELPLFRPEHGALAGLMDMSSARAQAAGLTLTDPAVTAQDVGRWCEGREWTPAMPLEREAELLACTNRPHGPR